MNDISLRDYFAAHAPDVPQNWFEPNMESKCPQSLFRDNHNGMTYISAFAAERACGFDGFYNINEEAIDAWKKEYGKQRFIQWPYARADEQIKARLPVSLTIHEHEFNAAR